MVKYNMLWIPLALCLLLCSCGGTVVPEPDDHPQPEPEKEAVEVHFLGADGQEITSLSLPGSGAAVSVTVSGTGAWRLECDDSWLQVRPAYGGEGQTEVSVSASAPNTSPASMITVLKAVQGIDGKACSSLEVEQEPFVVSKNIVFPPDPAVVFAAGGSTTVSFECASEWQAESLSPWLTVSPASGPAGLNEITFTTAANTQITDRIGIVYIHTASGYEGVLVRQHCEIFRRKHIRTTRVKHALTVKHGNGFRMSEIAILLPYPETNEYQVISDSQVSSGKIITSDTGVKYLMYHRTSNFPASGKEFISHTYTVDYYTRTTAFWQITEPALPFDTSTPEYKRYTDVCMGEEDGVMGEMIDPYNPKIAVWADNLWAKAGGSYVEYAKLCYDWVTSKFRYEIFYSHNTINDILNRMAGDCGNQTSIWISLVRAKGIPARPVVMISPIGSRQDEMGHHVCGEYYLAGYGWIPIDPTGFYVGLFPDDNFIVQNRDFSFDFTVGSETFNCPLLQSVWWLVWGDGNGLLDGTETFTEL